MENFPSIYRYIWYMIYKREKWNWKNALYKIFDPKFVLFTMPTNILTYNTIQRLREDKTLFLFVNNIDVFYPFCVLQALHRRYDSIKKYSYMELLIPRCLVYIIYTFKRKEVIDCVYLGEVGIAFDSKICNGERETTLYIQDAAGRYLLWKAVWGGFPVTLVTDSLFLLPHRIYI